jgi:hypothetical protein
MKHREPGITTAGRVGRALVYTACLAVLGTTLIGAAVALDGAPDPGPSIISSLPPSPEPSAETKAESKPSPTRPVRIARTTAEVLQRTRFVADYKAAEGPIANGHTDQNLALHGVDICARIEADDQSLWDMIDAFTTKYHPHAGPVTPKAALRTFGLAVQDICPDLMGRYTAKRDLAADAG